MPEDEEEGRVLEWRDFEWRVAKVARERSAWTEATRISTPALAAARPWDDAADASLVVLLYECDGPESANPYIRPPHAALGLRPDGEVAFFENLPRDPAADPIGERYGEALAESEPAAREAFKLTLYVALTDPDGPLWHPWSRLDPERRRDVAALFGACVEPALVAHYLRYTAEFMTLCGVELPPSA